MTKGLSDWTRRMADMRALVVGDLILDEYRDGTVDRVSPEAPVPIVRVRDSTLALGGAANVARNLRSLGAEVALCGVVGADDDGARLVELVGAVGIEADGIQVVGDRPTTHKLRVVARDQQLLRLDREADHSVSEDVSDRLLADYQAALGAVDVVLLADYGKGVLSESNARRLIECAAARNLPIAVDPKRSISRFRGASLLKPNWLEATRFTETPASDRAARRILCEKLRNATGGSEVVVTRGAQGMSALDREGVFADIPTQALEVYDVQGAGDAALAALALTRVAGASLVEACIVANATAAVAVEKFGTVAVERAELEARLPEAFAAFERSQGQLRASGTAGPSRQEES